MVTFLVIFIQRCLVLADGGITLPLAMGLYSIYCFLHGVTW